MGCPDDNALLAFIEDSLEDASARSGILAHLRGCASCRRLVAAADSSEPNEERAASRFGRYEILRTLGGGGMGVVYEALDPELDRRVAIKVLHAPVIDAARARALIGHEAAAMARLRHPNVVQVFDVGVAEHRMFFAMELVPGQTLRRWAEAGRSRAELLHALREVAAGIEAAHAAGVIHRDLKPGNVLVGADGRIAVADFGLARLADARASATGETGPGDPGASTPASDPPGDTTRPTFAGGGTPPYMAPEQHAREPADERTDVFAFSVLAYELLFGTLPFLGEDADALERAKRAGDIAAPRRHGRWAVRDVVARGLKANPAERWRSIADMRRALDRAAASPRWRTAALMLAPLVGIGALALIPRGVQQPSVCSADPPRVPWAAARSDVGEAFTRTGIGYAPMAWQRFTGRMDAFVSAWDRAADGLCHAGAASPAGAAVSACLEASREAGLALVGAASRPDPDLISRLDAAATALPDPSRCATPRVGRTLDLAVDPAPFAEVRAGVERARTLDTLGRTTDALAAAQAAVTQSMDVAAPARDELQGEAMLQRGSIRSRAGIAGATADLESAYYLGLRGGSDVVTAAAAVELIGDAVRRGQPREAERWAEHAASAIERRDVRDDPARNYHRRMAALREQQGRPADALAHAREGLALARAAVGEQHDEIGAHLHTVGRMLAAMGKHEEAHAAFLEARDITARTRGPDHPSVAVCEQALANVAYFRSDFEAGARHLQHAETLMEQAYGAAHPRTLQVRVTRAQVAGYAGDPETTRALLVPIMPQLERALAGSSALDVAYETLGYAEGLLGNHEAARRWLTRVVESWGERAPGGHIKWARALISLGSTIVEGGDSEAGRARIEQGLTMAESLPGGDTTVAEALVLLAELDDRIGEKERALARATRAVQLHASAHSAPKATAQAKALLARLQH